MDCWVCGWQSAETQQDPERHNVQLISCLRCGKYYYHRVVAAMGFPSNVERWRLSAIIRNSAAPPFLDHENIKRMIEGTAIPADPLEKMDLLLLYIKKRTSHGGESVKITLEIDYPTAYAKNPEELHYLLNQLEEQGLLRVDMVMTGPWSCSLLAEGWERLRELERKQPLSAPAFVAMWFDKSLDPAWEQGFKPALEESGYRPIRADLPEHNNKIDDHIIASIRKSGLLVADFTGQRGGVYFEAGFAKGLAVPIIYTCRKGEEENLHFDTRQYPHVIWEDQADLKKRLKDRIKALPPDQRPRAGE